jgi:hypothetical protein
VIEMDKEKLRKIQDLIVAITTNGEIIQFQVRSILNIYNFWVSGKEDLKLLIKSINSTFKIAKRFEKDLKDLKKLLRG